MSTELSHRCTLVLWLAMATALAAGLLAAPTLDPLAWLYRHHGVAATLVAGALHGLLCAAAMLWLLPRLGQPAAQQHRLAACAWALSALGLVLWAWSLAPHRAGDARLLLWLQLLPLSWALARWSARPSTVMGESASPITHASARP